MKEVLKEVPSGGVIVAHKKANKEIAAGAQLKHVETEHDASAPIIDKDAKVGKNPLPGVLSGLPKSSDDDTGATGAQLKHVETEHDASAPAIDKEAKIGEAPQKKVFAEISSKKKDDE